MKFFNAQRRIGICGLLAAAVSTLAWTGPAVADDDDDDEGRASMLYASTNAASGNAIVVMKRAADGSISVVDTVATSGQGSGGGLGNQGALTLSADGRWLYAVNAASNDISVFSARASKLVLLGKTGSGGVRPVSVTVHENLLYVLNAGGVNNISGFSIGESGMLKPIAGSTRPLSAATTGPAQVQFDHDGEALIVTEKATNKISTYVVNRRLASGPTVIDSKGMTPFGFAIDRRNRLIVSEAFGGKPDGSALSSYQINDDTGQLKLISPSVGTKQTAACWVVITKNGRYAYTTNTGSGSVSGYAVANDGQLSLLNADGRTAVIGAGTGPTDAALSPDSRYLYVLTAAVGTINAYRVGANGALVPIAGASGIASTATGLVAR